MSDYGNEDPELSALFAEVNQALSEGKNFDQELEQSELDKLSPQLHNALLIALKKTPSAQDGLLENFIEEQEALPLPRDRKHGLKSFDLDNQTVCNFRFNNHGSFREAIVTIASKDHPEILDPLCSCNCP